MSEWEKAVNEIRIDREQGASQLAVQALSILENASSLFPAVEPNEFREKLCNLAFELSSARPTMVVIGNTMSWFCELFDYCYKMNDSLELLREEAHRCVNALIGYFEASRQVIAGQAFELLSPGCTIMTCSYSSHVFRTLSLSQAREKNLQLLILESRWQGRSYGEMLAEQLRAQQIVCQVIPDEQMADCLSQVDLILIGGDALLPEGWLINGYPTLNLVQAVRQSLYPVPIWALLESLKISRQLVPIPIEEGFQAIPVSFLAGLINEQGIISDPEELKRWVGHPFPCLLHD